jgi:hypothetical protein
MPTKKPFLFTIALFSLLIITLGMMSNSLLYQNTLTKSSAGNNLFLSQSAFAQTVTTGPGSANASNGGSGGDGNEQTVLRQGLVASSQARQNETSHVAVILPHRDDGKSYSGILTFSATQPVSVALLQRLAVDNDTLAQMDFKKYAGSTPLWIRDIPSQHNLTQTALQVISGINPDYGTSTPYYSASIPFVASGVALWSHSGTPFLVAYQVSAKIGQPETVNNIGVKDTG